MFSVVINNILLLNNIIIIICTIIIVVLINHNHNDTNYYYYYVLLYNKFYLCECFDPGEVKQEVRHDCCLFWLFYFESRHRKCW